MAWPPLPSFSNCHDRSRSTVSGKPMKKELALAHCPALQAYHIPSCKGQQVQKMSKDSSRECYVNLPLKTKSGIPTAHQMNSSPTQSINIFKTETNLGPVRVPRGAHLYIEFLGYTFRCRKSWNRKQGQCFTNFLPAISRKSVKKLHEKMKGWKLHSLCRCFLAMAMTERVHHCSSGLSKTFPS